MFKDFDLNVYLIADFSYGIEKIEEALKAGVTMVQLREKNISSRCYLERALSLKELTTKYNVPLIINDRVDIALLSGSDGVHLGQNDLPIDKVKAITPPHFIIGATANTLSSALLAESHGASYIGSGAWFPTSTKEDATLIDKEEYVEIISQLKIPNVAIGGINPSNCHIPLSYKASGIAVSKGILGASNISATVAKLKTAKLL